MGIPDTATGLFVAIGAAVGVLGFIVGGRLMDRIGRKPAFLLYVRGRAATWCRKFFEIPGGIAGPLLVGLLGDPDTGIIRSVGDAMTLLTLLMVAPVLLIAWRLVPETSDLDLGAMDAAVAAAPPPAGVDRSPVSASPSACANTRSEHLLIAHSRSTKAAEACLPGLREGCTY